MSEQMQLLNVRQAAAFLGLSLSRLANWRCNGKGPVYIKLGGRVVYDRRDLEAFVKAGRVVPGKEAIHDC